jgi:hypothetical protein
MFSNRRSMVQRVQVLLGREVEEVYPESTLPNVAGRHNTFPPHLMKKGVISISQSYPLRKKSHGNDCVD